MHDTPAYYDEYFRPCDNPNCLGPMCSKKPIYEVAVREPRLFFTVAPQRAGKTTLAKRWHRREVDLGGFADDGFPRYYWDSDHLRLELYGKRHKFCGEPMVYAIKRYAIATALRSGNDVLVAGTHTSKSSVRRILEIRADAIPVVIETPVDVCIRRAYDTNQTDLVPVIRRTHQQCVDLLSEGIDRVISGILNDIKNRVPY